MISILGIRPPHLYIRQTTTLYGEPDSRTNVLSFGYADRASVVSEAYLMYASFSVDSSLLSRQFQKLAIGRRLQLQ